MIAWLKKITKLLSLATLSPVGSALPLLIPWLQFPHLQNGDTNNPKNDVLTEKFHMAENHRKG